MTGNARGSTNLKVIIGIIAVIGIGWGIHALRAKPPATAQEVVNGVTMEERKELYLKAVSDGNKMKATWPKTEQELISQFWQAASGGDLDRAVIFVPGASRNDFAIMEKFKPGPLKSIGAPQPHPTVPGVTLWPVTIPYPNYPEKTIQMALMHLPDGRLAIDGKNTIWW